MVSWIPTGSGFFVYVGIAVKFIGRSELKDMRHGATL